MKLKYSIILLIVKLFLINELLNLIICNISYYIMNFPSGINKVIRIRTKRFKLTWLLPSLSLV